MPWKRGGRRRVKNRWPWWVEILAGIVFGVIGWGGIVLGVVLIVSMIVEGDAHG